MNTSRDPAEVYDFEFWPDYPDDETMAAIHYFLAGAGIE